MKWKISKITSAGAIVGKYKYVVHAPGLDTYCNNNIDLDNAIRRGLKSIKGKSPGRCVTVEHIGWDSDLPVLHVTIPEWRNRNV